MNKKIRLGILFGGKSAEHEVSLQSAKNVINAIDKSKYEIILIGIDKKGGWFLNQESNFLLNDQNPKLIQLNQFNESLALVPGQVEKPLVNMSNFQSIGELDVIFPILHGTFGEDGTIQGLLKLANVPFVGAGVLGSAVGMDKDVMKRLLRDANIPISKFITVLKHQIDSLSFDAIADRLGMPLFVKPANLGSSVGISKVTDESSFNQAIQHAFLYDHKIIIEEFIDGREIECSVLGNEDPIASLPGEILLGQDFYSYEAKYIDEKGASLQIPANLSSDLINQLQSLAIRTYQTLCCEGMARVDFFLRGDELLINEINTIPGFTKISMYPKMWEASGISYSELIDRLIQLAIDRHKKENLLLTQLEA